MKDRSINGDAQQIVGRERRERLSQLAWCGGGCFDSRRRVNSTVIAPRTNGKTCSLNQGLNGFAFSARLGADETWVVGRRYNKSLDRSAFSRLIIRKTRMPGSWSPRPVNSNVRRLYLLKPKGGLPWKLSASCAARKPKKGDTLQESRITSCDHCARTANDCVRLIRVRS